VPKIGRFLVSVFLPFSIVSITTKSRIGVDSLIGGYKNGGCLQIGGGMHLTIPLLINHDNYIHLVCCLVSQVRAHPQGRQRGEKAQALPHYRVRMFCVLLYLAQTLLAWRLLLWQHLIRRRCRNRLES
jgi:hypothetical protein